MNKVFIHKFEYSQITTLIFIELKTPDKRCIRLPGYIYNGQLYKFL